jgi:hypothetical protein
MRAARDERRPSKVEKVAKGQEPAGLDELMLPLTIIVP